MRPIIAGASARRLSPDGCPGPATAARWAGAAGAAVTDAIRRLASWLGAARIVTVEPLPSTWRLLLQALNR
jgi:hypothetical protein